MEEREGVKTKTYFILPNSFGVGWGYKGYCLMPANYPVWDVWTPTEDMPDDWRLPPVAVKYGSFTQAGLIQGLYLKDYLWACFKLKRPPTEQEFYGLCYGRWPIQAITGEDKYSSIYWKYMTKDDFIRLMSELTGKLSDVIRLRKEGKLLRLPLAIGIN